MQQDLVKDITEALNSKLFGIMLQLLVSGFVMLAVKEFITKILDYINVKFSDFGRGTKLDIDGKVGYITKIGFNEVELDLGDGCTLLVPVDKFVNSNKIIMTHKKSFPSKENT